MKFDKRVLMKFDIINRSSYYSTWSWLVLTTCVKYEEMKEERNLKGWDNSFILLVGFLLGRDLQHLRHTKNHMIIHPNRVL